MTPRMKRQFPRPQDLAPARAVPTPDVALPSPPAENALTIEDLRKIAQRRTPRAAFDCADDSVRLLANSGRSAVRLEDGFPEWAAERLPSERSN